MYMYSVSGMETNNKVCVLQYSLVWQITRLTYS